MTTLTDIRTDVRNALRDLDGDAVRWSDAELDGHIERALTDLSLAAPLEATTTVATTAGSRLLATSLLPDFLTLEAVEAPIDAFPRRRVPFSVWAGAITLEGPAPPRGERVRIRYLARHTLDEEGSTVPEALNGILATGGAGHAAIAWAAFAIDRLDASEEVTAQRRAWGESRLRLFHARLRAHERPRRLGRGRLAALTSGGARVSQGVVGSHM